MNIPYWLLKLLPLFEYICPKCRKIVKANSHKCPHCGEKYPLAIRVPPSFLKDSKKLEAYVHKYIFPRVSKFERAYLAQYFTLILKSGWENSGGTDPTDGGIWQGTGGASPVVVTSPVHSGLYALECIGDASEVYDVWGLAYPTVFVRGYYYFKTLPVNDGELTSYTVIFDAAFNALVGFNISYSTVTGTQWVLNTLTQGNIYATAIINTLEWYCVEIEASQGIGNAVGALWVNNIQLAITTTETFANNPNYVQFGLNSSSTAVTPDIVVDDAQISDVYNGPITPPQNLSRNFIENLVVLTP